MSYLESRAGLNGKIAAVIGGAAGIGEAVSMGLAAAGLDLAICDWNVAALDHVRVAVEKLGRRVLVAEANVLIPAHIDAFYDRVGEAFPHLDVAVNVAGGTFRSAFMDTTAEDWEHDIQRNYRYVLQSVQRAVKLMRKSGTGGSIINFTTIEAHRGAGTFAVYAGAKAGLENFTRAVAVELGPEHIRVNTIAPDLTPSEGNRSAGRGKQRNAPSAAPSAAADASATSSVDGNAGSTGKSRLPPHIMQEAFNMYLPLQAPAPAESLADAVLFLASNLSAFTTGTTLHVDGGSAAAKGFINWPHGVGWLPAPRAKILARLFADPPAGGKE